MEVSILCEGILLTQSHTNTLTQNNSWHHGEWSIVFILTWTIQLLVYILLFVCICGREKQHASRKIGCVQYQSHSRQMPRNPFFSYTIVSHNHHSHCSWQLTALSFSLSFSPPHQEKPFLLARRDANACSLFLQGQNGRGVNEWQSVLITRRGYLGLVCLISANAFQFLMLPNCRLHQEGPFIMARQSSASNEAGT